LPTRQHIQLIDIADRANLTEAVYLAAKGRRKRSSVTTFLANLDQNLNSLSETLMDGKYAPQPLRQFVIHDPKRRVIHAPEFRDRVVHHAIILQAGAQLDRTLIDDSFACRVGKGSVAAVLRAQHFSRRFAWYAKLDIAKYFHSIDHSRLLEMLDRRFSGQPFRELLARIVDSFQAERGKGLPIGALTSQYFANLYLNEADRFCVAQRAVGGFVRYMDDMILWSSTKHGAIGSLARLTEFLWEHLGLRLSRPPEINRSTHGLAFCGHRIFPGIIRLSKRRQRQYLRTCLRWERRYLQGEASKGELQTGYASAYSITKLADSLQWRRRRLGQHLVDEA